MELGKYLKKLRKEKGKSLRQIEQKTGINSAHLSQLENGKIKNPSKDLIEKLESYYGFGIRKLEKERNSLPYVPLSMVLAQDLVVFADKVLSKSKASQIVKDLIVSTVIPKYLRMPTEEGIFLPGWDGQVVCGKDFGNQFVPDGNSYWEVSTNKNTKPKATEDFKKRTENPLGADPKNSTYVVVTFRGWPGRKEKWIKDMNDWTDQNQMSRWKSIRIIDGKDLELWFEKSPCIALQFARSIGKFPIKAKPLQEYWEEWYQSTEPGINETLLLESGRSFHHEFSEFLKDISANYCEIKSHDISLAVAYVYAAISTLKNEVLKKSLLSRVIVVEDKEAFKQLSNPGPYRLLIPLFEEPPIGIARKNGHRIICFSEDSKNIIDRVSKERIINVLERKGVTKENAQRYASKCHGNLSILRRLLCSTGEIGKPKWSELPIVHEVAQLNLFGSWSEENQCDIEFISSVLNKNYEDIKKDLKEIVSLQNSPLQKKGDIYTFNQELTFDDFHQLLDKKFIIKFLEKSSKELLSRYDSRFYESGGERFFAYKESSSHSSFLRKGVTTSYALLGNHYKANSNFPEIKPYVNKAVKEILEKKDDWRYWVSISDVLTLLTETSPDEFLDRLDKILHQTKGVNDSNSLFEIFKQCRYTSLLWALELCAWEKDHLKRATEILLLMNQHEDSFCNWTNKPSATLQNIYRLQIPQTSCSFNEKLKILDSLFENNRDQIWDLFLEIIPYSSPFKTLDQNNKAKYRDIQSSCDEIKTYGDLYQLTDTLFERIKRILESEPVRWFDFIDSVLKIPFGDKKIRFLEILKDLDISAFSKENKLKLWEKIEENYLQYLESFSKDPEDSIFKLLKDIYKKFTPIDPVEKWKRAFDDPWGFTHPSIIEKNIKENKDCDPMEMYNEMNSIRESGLKEIIEISDDKGIIKLIEKIKCIHIPILSNIYAKVLTDKGKKEEIICEFDFSDKKKKIFYKEFVQRCSLGNDSNEIPENIHWIQKVINKNQLEESRVIEICTSLPFSRKTWDLIKQSPKNIQNEYWSSVKYPRPQDLKTEDVLRAGEKILYYKRPYLIFRIVSYLDETKLNKLPTDFLMNILSELNYAPFNEKDFNQTDKMFSYRLEKILKFLEEKEDVDKKRLASIIKQPSMDFFHSYGEVRPESLINEVNRDPQTFLELLILAYKKDDGSTENSSQSHELSKRAHQFFLTYVTSPDSKDDSSMNSHTRVKLPGMSKEGKLDSHKFKKWVLEVRKLCKEHNIIKAADSILGQLFAHAPIDDKDQGWPHQAVRNIIEELKSDRLDQGFKIGITNKRGVFWGDLYEGGEQERKLADKYKTLAEKIRLLWPRTAKLLREIKEEYLSLGKIKDNKDRLEEYQDD